MATTTTINGAWSGNYRLVMIIDRTAVNIEKNQSTVRSRVWIESRNGASFYGYSSNHTQSIDGVSTYSGYIVRAVGINSSALVLENSRVITHNSDGTKTVASVAGFSNAITGSLSVSGSLTLDTIPRATTPTVAGNNFTTGTAKTITLSRASSSFTHDVTYTIGSKSGTIATGATTSASFNPAHSLATEFTNATSRQITIKVVTKNGSTVIGTKSVNFTLNLATNQVPTVSAVSWTDSNSVVATNIGAFVQGRSLIKGAIVASGVHGSTVTKKEVVIAGVTLPENQPTQIMGSGTITASGKATDSRNRVGTKAQNFTVLAYEEPKFGANNWNVQRANSSNVADPLGTYLRLDLHALVSSLKPASTEKNAMKIEVFTKASNGTEIARNVVNPGLSHNTAIQVSDGNIYSAGLSYEVRILITDNAGGRLEQVKTVSTATVAIHIGDNGTGVGKYHEQGALDVAGDGYFAGDIYAERINPFATKVALDAWSAPDGTLAFVAADNRYYVRVAARWEPIVHGATDWQSLPLQPGFTGSCRYKKVSGITEMRFDITGTVTSDTQITAALPEAYRASLEGSEFTPLPMYTYPEAAQDLSVAYVNGAGMLRATNRGGSTLTRFWGGDSWIARQS